MLAHLADVSSSRYRRASTGCSPQREKEGGGREQAGGLASFYKPKISMQKHLAKGGKEGENKREDFINPRAYNFLSEKEGGEKRGREVH